MALGSLVGAVAALPDRDTARELARAELSGSEYASEPGVLARVLEWLGDRLAALFGSGSGALPARVALVLLIGLLVVGVVVVLARSGLPTRSRRAGTDQVFTQGRRSPAEHRRAADRAAAAGDHTTAVLERFRAVAATLEDTGVLGPGPGRTADELAREAGTRHPEVATPLAHAATVFDAVCYGGRAGRPEDDAALRALDDQVRGRRGPRARRVPAAEPSAAPPS